SGLPSPPLTRGSKPGLPSPPWVRGDGTGSRGAPPVAPPPLPRPLQPLPRSRPRKELRIRVAGEADRAACMALDATYTTEYIWQLDTRLEADEWRTSFRLVHLPRSLTLSIEHHPPAMARGSLPRADLLWLVAEEVEGAESAAWGQEPQPPEPPAGHGGSSWSHELRRTRGASVMQLSLPSAPYTARAAATTAGPPAAPAAGSGPTSMDGAGSRSGSSGRKPTGEAPGGGPEGEPGTGAKAVGYVVAVASPRVVATPPPGRHVYLRTLVVDGAYRRRGIAARLLAETLRWAAALGAEDVMADVPARNYPALRLLQKAGFTFCGFNDRCYDDGEVALFLSTRLR